jgi:transposase
LLIGTTLYQEEERMIGMVDIEFIKKKHLQEGWSIRRIARVLSINRITVRKAISTKEIPRYRLTCEKPSPVIGPIKGIIEQWLKDDQTAPGKQRHTARRVYTRLVEEHQFSGSESSVRKWVRKLRGQVTEAFVPLEADAGKMGQVDWGTAEARIGGVESTVHLFVLRLRHSGVTFARAYLHETMECFLEGHKRAFEWLGGIPRTLVYDNLKTAVIRILSGPDREESTLMSALRTHYLFESAFCRPGEGHEKGSVENGVGHVRRNVRNPAMVDTESCMVDGDSCHDGHPPLSTGCRFPVQRC